VNYATAAAFRMALEARLSQRARDAVFTGEDVRLALAVPLSAGVDGEWFRFAVGLARPLRTDEAGRPGWRLPVEAALSGRAFEAISVDIVVRPDELIRTERVPLPSPLAFAGIAAGDIEVVARTQHFAEKLHALTRTYSDGHRRV
jgi:hypothetical protein